MTVAELIDALNKVEDKSKKICIEQEQVIGNNTEAVDIYETAFKVILYEWI